MQVVEHITEARERGWEWFAQRAHGRHALGWMLGLSFLEPIISPIVAETLMAAMLITGSDQGRWQRYAALCSIASFLGGLVAYGFGMLLFMGFGSSLVSLWGLSDITARASEFLTGSAFVILFFATLTPVPDKMVTVASGFFGVAFVPYALGYLLGRSARFFIVAYLVHRYGARVLELINRYSLYAVLLALMLLAAYIIVVHFGLWLF